MKNNFLKVVGDGLGTLVGVPMAPKKIDPTKNYNFFRPTCFLVIERYGYQSIRTDLIKLSRLVLNRFEEKKIKGKYGYTNFSVLASLPRKIPDFAPKDSRFHFRKIPGTPGIGSVFLIHPTGQKRQEKTRFFLEWGRNAFVRHAAFSKHDAILQRIQPWPPKNPIPT